MEEVISLSYEEFYTLKAQNPDMTQVAVLQAPTPPPTNNIAEQVTALMNRMDNPCPHPYLSQSSASGYLTYTTLGPITSSGVESSWNEKMMDKMPMVSERNPFLIDAAEPERDASVEELMDINGNPAPELKQNDGMEVDLTVPFKPLPGKFLTKCY
jgi:hypothetical protein